jgi:hypothetical protein
MKMKIPKKKKRGGDQIGVPPTKMKKKKYPSGGDGEGEGGVTQSSPSRAAATLPSAKLGIDRGIGGFAKKGRRKKT